MSKTYFLLLACCFCFACANTNNFKKVKVLAVYDGDTFKVNLSCREKLVCKDIPVRVKGIDTPELTTKNSFEKEKAQKAKNFMEKLLSSGQISLKNCQRDKYFRLLCEVFIKCKKEKLNLAEELLKIKLAVKYNRETKIKS